MQSNVKRSVFIALTRGAWMVFYTERQKGQRYTAGQFDARMTTKEQVQTWISQQPNITLIP